MDVPFSASSSNGSTGTSKTHGLGQERLQKTWHRGMHELDKDKANGICYSPLLMSSRGLDCPTRFQNSNISA